jgi:hypothetical protein
MDLSLSFLGYDKFFTNLAYQVTYQLYGYQSLGNQLNQYSKNRDG